MSLGTAEDFVHPNLRIVEDQFTINGREVNYRQITGGTGPGLFVIPGFAQHIDEPKARHLFEKCRDEGRNFASFTYSGLEAAQQTIEDFSLTGWIAEARGAFDNLTQGPQVIVASSFATTSAFQIAQRNAERVHGIILVGPGTSLMEHMVKPVLGHSEKRLQAFRENGFFKYPIVTPWGQKKFVKVSAEEIAAEQANEFFREDVLAKKPLPPMAIIHAEHDKHVPFKASARLATLASAVLHIIRGEDAFHELNRPEDCDFIWKCVKKFADPVPATA